MAGPRNGGNGPGSPHRQDPASRRPRPETWCDAGHEYSVLAAPPGPAAME